MLSTVGVLLLMSVQVPQPQMGMLAGPRSSNHPPPAVTNDNRSRAGVSSAGITTAELEAKLGTWYPEGPDGPGVVVAAFAEPGKAPSVPAPLLRVLVGTELRITMRNSLATALRVRGLHAHDGGAADSLNLLPGEAREVRFRATAPGTYFYWGRTEDDRDGLGYGDDSQLIGGFIVDPAATVPEDRVLVIGLWVDQRDTVKTPGHHPLETITVNGLSWPHTERLTYSVGDTARWRVINASVAPHPMHLHGFYFQVMSRGDAGRDTVFSARDARTAVTEFMRSATTMTLTWVPRRVGNWLFHCHLIAHVATHLRLGRDAHAGGVHSKRNHMEHDMAGLVTGIHILPRKGYGLVENQSLRRRRIDAFINSRAGYFETRSAISLIVQEGAEAPAMDSVLVPGSTLRLTRGEPTEIIVHNRSPERVTVHWHGIELDSYYDGVGDWSGEAMRIAPVIAPGDTFVVRVTPDRAGTFIYHTHMEESEQLNAGLYGPLIVREPGEKEDLEHDRILLLGWNGPTKDAPAALNGERTPAMWLLTAGQTYRLRFINISPSGIAHVRLQAADSVQKWRLFAKDGATVPAHQAVVRPAILTLGPGETYDFEFTPKEAGDMELLAQLGQRGRPPGSVKVTIRIR
jgi:FtsP/CotA-like multicopper oxidase with cupredoxin domain